MKVLNLSHWSVILFIGIFCVESFAAAPANMSVSEWKGMDPNLAASQGQDPQIQHNKQLPRLPGSKTGPKKILVEDGVTPAYDLEAVAQSSRYMTGIDLDAETVGNGAQVPTHSAQPSSN